ncbi:MAG: hypothetical protein R3A80_03295 [Bdellovibrionota bacterium]
MQCFVAEGVEPGHDGSGGGSSSASVSDLKGFIDRLNTSEVFRRSRAQCASGATFKNGKRVGRMSTGYFYGMMLTFSKAVCRIKEAQSGDLYSATLTSKAGSMSRKDTFAHERYRQSLQGDPLVQNYSLLLSLGMLESGGKYNEGIDRSASNTDGITTEAGLFQVSFNSVNSSQVPNRIYDELMAKYERGQNGVACMTGIFNIDQRLSKNTKSFGSGAALEFQNAMKSCPAMAAEYMSILLRKDVNHNGPLKRQEAQPSPECSQALTEVKKIAESNCNNLDAIARSQAPAESLRFEVSKDREFKDIDLARQRGGSSLSQMEDELEQLKAERANATTDAERSALDEKIKSAEANFAEAQKNPDLLKERDAVEQRINDAVKADQVKSEQLLDTLTKSEGYVERSPEDIQRLANEAAKLDQEAKLAEAAAQQEKKKPRSQQDQGILGAANSARQAATAKSNEFIRAKQVQELQQKVEEREQQLQGNAVEAKKAELNAAKQERESSGEVNPSESEKKITAELKQLEGKLAASQTALTTEREVRQALEDIKKEFPILPRDPAQMGTMIPKITEQLALLEERIASIDSESTVVGDADRLRLLMELRRRLRAELVYYQKLNKP